MYAKSAFANWSIFIHAVPITSMNIAAFELDKDISFIQLTASFYQAYYRLIPGGAIEVS